MNILSTSGKKKERHPFYWNREWIGLQDAAE